MAAYSQPLLVKQDGAAGQLNRTIHEELTVVVSPILNFPNLTMPQVPHPRLHTCVMFFILISSLISLITASPAVTVALPPLMDELHEGPINVSNMLCETRLRGSVEVTLGGKKMMVPHVECINCNAPCGEGGIGRCTQVIDNSSGQAWKRGCQCQVPVKRG